MYYGLFLKIEGCSVSISSAIYIVILYYFSNYNRSCFSRS